MKEVKEVELFPGVVVVTIAVSILMFLACQVYRVGVAAKKAARAFSRSWQLDPYRHRDRYNNVLRLLAGEKVRGVGDTFYYSLFARPAVCRWKDVESADECVRILYSYLRTIEMQRGAKNRLTRSLRNWAEQVEREAAQVIFIYPEDKDYELQESRLKYPATILEFHPLFLERMEMICQGRVKELLIPDPSEAYIGTDLLRASALLEPEEILMRPLTGSALPETNTALLLHASNGHS